MKKKTNLQKVQQQQYLRVLHECLRDYRIYEVRNHCSQRQNMQNELIMCCDTSTSICTFPPFRLTSRQQHHYELEDSTDRLVVATSQSPKAVLDKVHLLGYWTTTSQRMPIPKISMIPRMLQRYKGIVVNEQNQYHRVDTMAAMEYKPMTS